VFFETRQLSFSFSLATGVFVSTVAFAVPDPSSADYVNLNKSSSFTWNSTTQWSPTGVPNGPGVSVHLEKTSGGDRNVGMSNSVPITVGTIYENNHGTSVGRNRVRNGQLIFDSGDPNEPARIFKIGQSAPHPGWPVGNPPAELGTSDARLEFRMDQPGNFVRLDSDLVIHVDAPNVEQGGHVRFRGSLEGTGSLIVDGPGEVRFRGDGEGNFNPMTQKYSGQHDYTYTGETIIREGMLRLRMSDLVGTSAIRVEDGGQLRLDARGSVSSALASWIGPGNNMPPETSVNPASGAGRPVEFFYQLGGPGTVLTINGYGRDFSDDRLGGPHGAIRMQGQGTKQDIGWVANDIVIEDFAAIMTNRNNADLSDLTTYPEITERGSVLHLTGNVSGGDLIKRGGGYLHLHGTNTFADTIMHNGELIVEPTSSLGSGALEFTFNHPLDIYDTSTANIRTLRLNNSAQTINRLSGAITGGGEIRIIMAGSHVLSANQHVDSEFEGSLQGSGAFVKAGLGQLILSGVSSHTGSTTVAEGTLLVRGELNSNGNVTVENGGVLAGSGKVGHLSGNGIVRPDSGANPATFFPRLTATSLDGSAGMDFQFLINGPNANLTNQFNSVNSVLSLTQGFNSSLAGSTIELLFADSISLSEGAAFTGGFLTSVDHLPEISSAQVVGYQGGVATPWSFDVETTAVSGGFLTRFVASASGSTYEADFNNDGFVDGDDLVIWENAFANNPSADADGDGNSDGHDFLIWQRQFGSGMSPPTTAQVVPEPTALWLVLTGCALLAPRRMRRI